MSTSGATSPTTSPIWSSTRMGTIIGGSIGGTVGITLIALGVILCRRRINSGGAPAISGALPRNFRRGRVSPFILTGAPAILSIPPSKLRSERTDPVTLQEEAWFEHRTSYSQEIATSRGQGSLSTQGFAGELARNRWRNWVLTFNGRVRRDLLPRSAAKMIPVSVGPPSNVF
ncbi:hypothetical protein BD779DRAFT_1557254, partial [Infundibulicybe gibba]